MEVLKSAGISVLAVEAGNTILLEPELVTDVARKAKAAIVALNTEDIEAGR